MGPWGSNPFQVLTFIVAPAILTNASSVMALATSNRFARTVDRTRALYAQVKGGEGDPGRAHRQRQLDFAVRRVRRLVRALTAFYLSVGSFAATSLVSLLGAVFSVGEQDVWRPVTL